MTREFKVNISAPSIIKTGGTAAQYLMADGSVTTGGTTTNALTIGTGLSGTSFNGSAAVTIANTGVLSINGSSGTITNVAKTDVANTFTLNQIISGSLTATSIIKSGGTSNQYLMADGTVTTSSGVKYTYSATAPISPTAGDVWVDTSDGTELTYINDGDTSQWVELSGGVFANPSIDLVTSSVVAQIVNKSDLNYSFNSKTSSYTLDILDNGKVVEVNSGGATTITIPTNTVAFPIGATITVVQAGDGQVTIAALTPGTTTVNATPGLNLRTKWSSATLIKRSNEVWYVFGDLTT